MFLCRIMILKFNLIPLFSTFSRVPTSPRNGNSSSGSSQHQTLHLHRINPEYIGAPVHVSNSYNHGMYYVQFLPKKMAVTAGMPFSKHSVNRLIDELTLKFQFSYFLIILNCFLSIKFQKINLMLLF